MNKKVIVPVSITTGWCSPAFFVPKADMIRVRLVTDYTHLNKYVKRPQRENDVLLLLFFQERAAKQETHADARHDCYKEPPIHNRHGWLVGR